MLLAATLAAAPIPPVDPSRLQEKAFRHPDLDIATEYRRIDQLPGDFGSDLAVLSVPEGAGVLDLRGGRWVTLLPSRPLIPGSGVRNALRWQDLSRREPASTPELKDAAWSAFAGFLARHPNELRIALDELEPKPRITVHDGGRLVQIVAHRMIGGIEARDTYLTAVINSGNLVLFGARNWGDLAIDTTPTLDSPSALDKLWQHLAAVSSEPNWRNAHLRSCRSPAF